MLHSRRIRKITFGTSPLNQGLAFAIKGNINLNGSQYKVHSIEEDGQYFTEYGQMRYNVYLKPVGTNEEEFVWKSAINVPTTIEYFMPTDEDDVVTVS